MLERWYRIICMGDEWEERRDEKTCEKCGRRFTFADTQGEGQNMWDTFETRLDRWTSHYCGCKHPEGSSERQSRKEVK